MIRGAGGLDQGLEVGPLKAQSSCTCKGGLDSDLDLGLLKGQGTRTCKWVSAHFGDVARCCDEVPCISQMANDSDLIRRGRFGGLIEVGEFSLQPVISEEPLLALSPYPDPISPRVVDLVVQQLLHHEKAIVWVEDRY